MVESSIKSDINKTQQSAETSTQANAKAAETSQATRPQSASKAIPPALVSPPVVIWTPSFIVLFTLTLVLGLSAESLFTMGWINHYYAGGWVLLGHVALIAGCWIATAMRTRSPWLRIGGMFGCIWAIFTTINLVINLHTVNPDSPILAHLSAATGCALLGTFICLSIEHTPHGHWDTWFFIFAPLLSGIAVVLAYIFTPSDVRTFTSFENDITIVGLVLCAVLWWLRPSCWHTQPGPTLLFGLAPVIALLLAIPGSATVNTIFFFSQVSLLCLLLGAMRILQVEIVQR